MRDFQIVISDGESQLSYLSWGEIFKTVCFNYYYYVRSGQPASGNVCRSDGSKLTENEAKTKMSALLLR